MITLLENFQASLLRPYDRTSMKMKMLEWQEIAGTYKDSRILIFRLMLRCIIRTDFCWSLESRGFDSQWSHWNFLVT